MKDDIECQIKFIGEIENNPALYDHNHPDYNNRKITEAIWAKIGEIFNERDYDCKLKWKSIRSAYIRTLRNNSGGNPKKVYYMEPYLKFLNPFTYSKSSSGEGSLSTTKKKCENESSKDPSSNNSCFNKQMIVEAIKEEIDSIDESSNSVNDAIFVDECSRNSIHGSEELAKVNPLLIGKLRKRHIVDEGDPKDLDDSFSFKKNTTEHQRTEKLHRDPCEMFLLSLVPHMESMTQHQQLRFQRGVLDLIENIKYEPSRSVL